MGKRPKLKSRQPLAGIILKFTLISSILIKRTIEHRKILVTYINSEILLEELQNEMRAICQFNPEQEFTMKWIDEEGILYFLD